MKIILSISPCDDDGVKGVCFLYSEQLLILEKKVPPLFSLC